MDLSESIHKITEAINSASNEKELKIVTRNLCTQYGIESYLFGASIYSNLNSTPKIYIINGYPSEWRIRYDEKSYITDDITVHHCRKKNIPLVWPVNSRDLSKISKLIFSESASFGISSGISFPYHGSTNEFGMFSISSPDIFSKSKINDSITQYLAQILGGALFDYYRIRESNNSLSKLTLREIECLKWVAAGKTSWETSVILNISERTVIFHIKNATSKMNTTSRTTAAVVAAMNGII